MVDTMTLRHAGQNGPDPVGVHRCNGPKTLLSIVQHHVLRLRIDEEEEALLLRLVQTRSPDDVVMSTGMILCADDRDSV
jgi:hypothetical protein